MNNSETPRRVSDMASDDRPREKALQYGVESLTDTELIAIALGSGIVGKSVIDVSREILASVGDNPALLRRMTLQKLQKQFKGIGPAKAVQLLAAIELGVRVQSRASYESFRPISSSKDIHAIMQANGNKPVEEMWALLLDRRNRLIRREMISRGGTAATVVDMKVIFAHALDHLANGIILVHNHPSGNLRPSPEDDRLTRRAADAAKLLDMRLFDHLIVTEEGYYSYADEGRL
ncbi:MAG: DNA repair protein RadC [Clostridium sp.]|nr:DNA repair protein RadC [Clostridium sp.]